MKLRIREREEHYPATITAAAKAAGVSVASLKLYDQAGVIVPARDSANRRLYTPQDIQAIRKYREQRGRK